MTMSMLFLIIIFSPLAIIGLFTIIDGLSSYSSYKDILLEYPWDE